MRGSAARWRNRPATVASRLPSSTHTISQATPRLSSTGITRAKNRSSTGASSCAGTTTERSLPARERRAGAGPDACGGPSPSAPPRSAPWLMTSP